MLRLRAPARRPAPRPGGPHRGAPGGFSRPPRLPRRLLRPGAGPAVTGPGRKADYNRLWLANREEGVSMTVPALSPLDGDGVEAALAAALDAIAQASTLEELKEARIAHAGDRSPLAQANRAIRSLAKEDRATAGKTVGQARGRVNQAIARRQVALEEERDAHI